MIIMITGGQRSGKSVIAERMALERSASPIYLATARVWDDDFRQRVEIHQQRRGKEWTTIEEPLMVGDIRVSKGSTVLLDCLTLLATNWFFESREDVGEALWKLKEQLTRLLSPEADFIVVTNEIGLGGISPNTLQRHFADLQGWVNQFVAAMADEVYFVVSGLTIKVK